ncbi:hypothetical protein HDU77_005391 [Chytriomyces hyalinus]|nr:hypothetical protein HDU77_005391 [Chytriomyces hyalinus]
MDCTDSNITIAPVTPEAVRPDIEKAFGSESIPAAFRGRTPGARSKLSQPGRSKALRTTSHPNVLDVDKATASELRQLFARNGSMLAKSAFVASLPDGGKALREMNERIAVRLSLENKESAVSPASVHATDSSPSRNSSSHEKSTVAELEDMVASMDLKTNTHGSAQTMTDRQFKIFQAGGRIPVELKPTKVKLLSQQQSIDIESERLRASQEFALQEPEPLLKLALKDGKKPQFDAMKYRNAAAMQDSDDEDESDDGSGLFTDDEDDDVAE